MLSKVAMKELLFRLVIVTIGDHTLTCVPFHLPHVVGKLCLNGKIFVFSFEPTMLDVEKS